MSEHELHEEVRQEEDRIRGRQVVAAIGITAAVLIGCTAWAWYLMGDHREALGAGVRDAELGTVRQETRPGAPVIGDVAVEQRLVPQDSPVLGHAARSEPSLAGYAWVSEELGIAQIPIELAMRVLIARQEAFADPVAAERP